MAAPAEELEAFKRHAQFRALLAILSLPGFLVQTSLDKYRSSLAQILRHDLRLAADAVSPMYSPYLSARRRGAAVDVKTY